MSGGHFDYSQHFINDIADEIEEEIRNNKKKGDWISDERWEEKGKQQFSDETIKEFKKAVKVLRKAYIYAHRIDWLLSGDDGEETFHERLKEDLKLC